MKAPKKPKWLARMQADRPKEPKMSGQVAVPVNAAVAQSVANLATMAVPIYAQLVAKEYEMALRAAMDKASAEGAEDLGEIAVPVGRAANIAWAAAQQLNAIAVQAMRGAGPKLATG